MKNGKAARPDGIPAEALKTDVETTADMLPLFEKIWEQEEMPTDWKDGHTIKLPKKGDLSRCENYRGSTLLLVSHMPGKVFNRILLERKRGAVDVTFPPLTYTPSYSLLYIYIYIHNIYIYI